MPGISQMKGTSGVSGHPFIRSSLRLRRIEHARVGTSEACKVIVPIVRGTPVCKSEGGSASSIAS